MVIAIVGILSFAITVMAANTAQAFVGVPPVAAIAPEVAASLGIGSGVAGTTAAAGVTGAATVVAGASAVVVGGFGIGYGIGWLGKKAVNVVWSEWFGDHPVTSPDAPPGGIGPYVFTGNGTAVMSWAVDTVNGGVNVTVSPAGVGGNNSQLIGRCVGTTGARFSVWNGVHFYPPSMGVSACPDGAEVYGVIGGVASAPQPFVINPMSPTGPAGYVAVNETDCMDVATGAITTITQTTPVASPSTPTGALPEAECPTGSRAVASRIKIVGVDGAGTQLPAYSTEVSHWNLPSSLSDPGYQYHSCIVTTTPCELTPKTQLPDGTVTDWNASPNPSTGVITQPDFCQWGPYQLAASACQPMITEYQSTQPTPTPAPTATPIPNPLTDPNDAEEANKCWPSGLGVFNPFEWVYKPVKCVLIWAYNPPPGSTDGWKDRFNDWKSRPPISFMVGGFDVLTDVQQDWGQCDAELSCSTAMYSPTVNGSPRYTLDLFKDTGDRMQTTTWGIIIYKIATISMWVSFMFFAWKRIGKSFGEKA